jgi:hypothetical protein
MREALAAAVLLVLAACGASSAPPAPVTRPASPPAQEAEPEKRPYEAPPGSPPSAGAAVQAPFTEAPIRSEVPATNEFAARVRPILEARCRPCHFEGGVMYARLPFDQEMTIRTLGTKLFTRIKDEKEQAILRAFLEGPG